MRGEIVARGKKANQVKVRLDNGEIVLAVITQSLLRQIESRNGALHGLPVWVALRDPPKNHRVIEILNGI